MKKRALISVSDKTDIIEFAIELERLGWEIISSDGTYKILSEKCQNIKRISDITGFPEILDGRVKTLNPKIYAGILAIRENIAHISQIAEHKIEPVDMVVVNLYPFEQTIEKIPKPADKDIDQQIIENIDVGGVSLLRAAAKNYRDILVVSAIEDYKIVLDAIKNGTADKNFRLALSAKAFGITAYYDALIANYLNYEFFPSYQTFGMKKSASLRYGENPHQQAAVYSLKGGGKSSSLAEAKQLHGKDLSYNNYLDIEAAWRLVNEFSDNACAIIKHNNPCGCAAYHDQERAYLAALACDPVSAFGGVIAFNSVLDAPTAKQISRLFVECIIAKNFTKEALEILSLKKNIRLLAQDFTNGAIVLEKEFRMISGGVLVQDKDNQNVKSFRIASKREPIKKEKEALDFAWKVAKHVKSNAIVLARHKQTVGIGAGQMSRIDALNIAVEKMKEMTSDSIDENFPLVMASDAFFPFGDVIEKASKAGVKAVIWPSGSIRDDESIKIANDNDIAMIATDMRHFRH
jgi:phosphoribosylaminoimidazolecarboxamide formyltransferase/IMP cyclohydrolase